MHSKNWRPSSTKPPWLQALRTPKKKSSPQHMNVSTFPTSNPLFQHKPIKLPPTPLDPIPHGLFSSR
ncbi:hypothetical protein CUMW_163360 [Citrus unshiu]|uniref:Uncharacterized protein n=1 Tax=Citrus unshiu TaxID=55188 RepID=A0A2H5PT98_CITUN|nr:hypothetical protein CUMW_163360 [Citrus unshiu]